MIFETYPANSFRNIWILVIPTEIVGFFVNTSRFNKNFSNMETPHESSWRMLSEP